MFILAGLFFSKSKGLVMKGYNKASYVTEQLTTGSDDNVPIEFNVILFFPIIIISFLRVRTNMNLIEYLFNILVSIIQILYLFSIETGSILNTMIYVKNIALWFWVISFVLFIFFIQFFFIISRTKIRISRIVRKLGTPKKNRKPVKKPVNLTHNQLNSSRRDL
jgi:predicted membrane protein